MESFTTDDSLHSNHSESILPQDSPENNMTDINMSIIHLEADTCRDIFSTPMVTLPPQNSFPYISTPTVRPAPGLMCAPPTAQINIHMMLIDLNNQIAGLRDFNKSLLDQLTSANMKIDFLVKKISVIQEYQSPSVAPVSIPDSDSTQHVSVNSSATTVEPQQPLRPGIVSYSSVVRDSNITSPPRIQRRQASKTLIMGDSILGRINKKGLKNNVEVLHYPGAKIDTVCDKIKLFNLAEFKHVVLYVGGNNATNSQGMNETYEYYEERLDQLISYIKTENAECDIFICNMCPRSDKNVSTINTIILRQCETHSVIHIDAYRGFFSKRNQLRQHFFKPWDNVHLSRAGTRRLLGIINEQIEIVEDFAYCAYNDRPGDHTRGNSGSNRRPHPPDNGHSVSAPRGSYNDRNSKSGSKQRGRYMNRPRRRNTDDEDVITDRCLKCGLKNHITSDCRHQNQIQCRSCLFYGHKDYNCPNA